jgi:alpha-aminoadipate carrier protein LysW
MAVFILCESSYQGEHPMTTQMNAALCPECDAEIGIPTDAMLNELISCPDCGAELEILNLEPVELELAPEVEEDWGE